MMAPYYVVAVEPGRGEVWRSSGHVTLDSARTARQDSAAQNPDLVFHIRDGHNETVVNIEGRFVARRPEEE